MIFGLSRFASTAGSGGGLPPEPGRARRSGGAASDNERSFAPGWGGGVARGSPWAFPGRPAAPALKLKPWRVSQC